VEHSEKLEKARELSGEAGEASFSELFWAQQTLISRAFPGFSGRQTRHQVSYRSAIFFISGMRAFSGEAQHIY